MAWFHDLNSDVQNAIKWFAAEFKYLKELKEDLEKIKRDATVSEQEKDYRKVRMAWYYVRRCERRAERNVERVISDLRPTVQTNPNIATLEKQIEISSEKLLKAFSFYTGDFQRKLVFLSLQFRTRHKYFGEKEREAELNIKNTASEIEQYLDTLIQWVGGLEASLIQINESIKISDNSLDANERLDDNFRNKSLPDKIKSFCNDFLRFFYIFADYHKQGLYPLQHEEDFSFSSINKKYELIREAIILSDKLNKRTDLNTILKIKELLEGIGHLFPFGSGKDIVTQERIKIYHYCEKIEKQLYPRYLEIIKRLEALIGGITKDTSIVGNKKFKIKQAIKISDSTINLEVICDFSTEGLMALKTYLDKLNIQINNEFLIQDIAKYILDIVQQYFFENPHWIFANKINLSVVLCSDLGDLGGQGETFSFSKYHDYVITLLFNELDMSEWQSTSKNKSSLKLTRAFRNLVHELGHVRDQEVGVLGHINLTYPDEKEGLERREKMARKILKYDQPVRQIIDYAEILDEIRLEGYASFHEWLHNSLISKSFIIEPDFLYRLAPRKTFYNTKELSELPKEFKLIFEHYLTPYKQFEYYIRHLKERLHFDYQYSYGALVYTFMLVYSLRKHTNNLLYVLSSQEEGCNKDELISFLNNEFKKKGALDDFWKLTNNQRLIILKKRFKIEEPQKISKIPMSYIILISPELFKNVGAIMNLFDMPIEHFDVYAAKACEYCGFKNHFFWDLPFLQNIQLKCLQDDATRVKELGF